MNTARQLFDDWLNQKQHVHTFVEHLDANYVIVPKEVEKESELCYLCKSPICPMKSVKPPEPKIEPEWHKNGPCIVETCSVCSPKPKKIEQLVCEGTLEDPTPIASHESLLKVARKLNEMIEVLNSLTQSK